MKTRLVRYSIGCGLFLLGSSGCTSIVRKPDIAHVKRAAIISLSGNKKVVRLGGPGTLDGWTPTFQAQVAEEAVPVFSTHLVKLGWQIQPSESLAEFFASPKVGGSEERFTAPGWKALSVDGSHPTDPQVLADLAKKLRVDAVVLIQLEYCYERGRYSMMGNGEAVITAAAYLQAVDGNGNIVIQMPRDEPCGDRRFESQATVTMNEGNLLFSRLSPERLLKMFAEATDQAAEYSVQKVRAAMQ